MKKQSVFLLSFLLAAFLLAGIASANTMNMTAYDGYSTNQDWHQAPEDEEVEPGMAHGQQWDLEAFFFDRGSMIMDLVGGYDFANGEMGSGHLWESGDIFLDVDGDAEYGWKDYGDISYYKNNVVNDTFGFDYVLDLDFDKMTYEIFELTENTTTLSVYFHANQGSNAWRYNDGGIFLGTGAIVYQTGLTDQQVADMSDDDDAFLGGSHNVVTVDLSFLNERDDYTDTYYLLSSYTMQCGNDNIIGRDPVPEPSTMVLLGLGLIGLAAFGRKRMKKS